MYIIPKIIIGDTDEFPMDDADVLIYWRTNGNSFIRIQGVWQKFTINPYATMRADSGIQVTTANVETYIKFTHPYPPGTKYSLRAWVTGTKGTEGITITRKYPHGFYLIATGAGVCGYDATVRI